MHFVYYCVENSRTNQTSASNISSAAIYVGLKKLIRTKGIKHGDKILLLVSKSGRFPLWNDIAYCRIDIFQCQIHKQKKDLSAG